MSIPRRKPATQQEKVGRKDDPDALRLRRPGLLYTAGDERIWTFEVGKNQSRWTIRDLGGKVLRDYFNDGTWTVDTDYLYRDAQLLATETRHGRRHFHLDHLGTPRLITNGAGYPVAFHVYYPFGEEATAFNQDRERMKFTGHERDLASLAGAGDDLDYMHARHCSPVTGSPVAPLEIAVAPQVAWRLGPSPSVVGLKSPVPPNQVPSE